MSRMLKVRICKVILMSIIYIYLQHIHSILSLQIFLILFNLKFENNKIAMIIEHTLLQKNLKKEKNRGRERFSL